jgi:hypothetical protein
MSVEQLSEREQQALEHLQKAQVLEVTLAEYARSFDLDVKELYSAKQALVRKGVIASRAVGDPVDEAQPGDFVPVQVAPSSSSTSSTAVCRIRHPSGLVIECASFPPVSWLAALLPGASDVPA